MIAVYRLMTIATLNVIGPLYQLDESDSALQSRLYKWIPCTGLPKMLSNLAKESKEMEDREVVLGFKPQKENIYNKFLPDSPLIDEESNQVFAEIKGNLARSIQLRDIKFGAGHWVGQVSR